MPFYFAWVDPEENTFLPEHQREDEKVLAFEINHAEGEFASLSINIKNPRVGLLSSGRKLWAWLAWDSGATDPGIVPLFFGRLLGVPEDLQGETLDLTFLARPFDWNEQRAALANSMKVYPYWDPIWVREDNENDPDEVLEARSQLWHTDRVSHIVSASDINSGEDGIVNFAGGFFRDSLQMRYSTNPGRRVNVEATVSWDQHAGGTVDLKSALVHAFELAGSNVPGFITSFTGEGLQRSWPTHGRRIGAGWGFGDCTLERVDGVVTNNLSADAEQVVTTANGWIVSFPRWVFNPSLNVQYDVTRSLSETIRFTVEADVQPLLVDPGDEEVIALSIQSHRLNDPVDPGGALPIFDERRRSFFQTDRGWDAIANLVSRARAQLLSRARAVEISFDVPWIDGIELSCRKNGTIADARLPGGTATGKITSYVLRAGGSTGMVAHVVLGCTVGNGSVVTHETGDPTYVEDGYVEDGYQVRLGFDVMPLAGEITFVPPQGIEPNDDGVDFTRMTPERVLKPYENSFGSFPGIEVLFGETAQRAILTEGGQDVQAIISALNTGYTTVNLNLVPLTRGPFTTEYEMTASDLSVPKTIDLEAA